MEFFAEKARRTDCGSRDRWLIHAEQSQDGSAQSASGGDISIAKKWMIET
jgi:hypothetical protein